MKRSSSPSTPSTTVSLPPPAVMAPAVKSPAVKSPAVKSPAEAPNFHKGAAHTPSAKELEQQVIESEIKDLENLVEEIQQQKVDTLGLNFEIEVLSID